MIVSAGYSELFSWATPIGMGSDCAIKLSEEIIKNRPKRLIFVGSMGLYSKNYELFSIYEFNFASNVELALLDDLVYSPMNDAKIHKINSSNYICKNYEKAKQMVEKYGFIGENMECFSFFNTANYFKIPAKAYLIATNYCDELAHETYLKNSQKANEKLENYLEIKGII